MKPLNLTNRRGCVGTIMARLGILARMAGAVAHWPQGRSHPGVLRSPKLERLGRRVFCVNKSQNEKPQPGISHSSAPAVPLCFWGSHSAPRVGCIRPAASVAVAKCASAWKSRFVAGATRWRGCFGALVLVASTYICCNSLYHADLAPLFAVFRAALGDIVGECALKQGCRSSLMYSVPT